MISFFLSIVFLQSDILPLFSQHSTNAHTIQIFVLFLKPLWNSNIKFTATWKLNSIQVLLWVTAGNNHWRPSLNCRVISKILHGHSSSWQQFLSLTYVQEGHYYKATDPLSSFLVFSYVYTQVGLSHCKFEVGWDKTAYETWTSISDYNLYQLQLVSSLHHDMMLTSDLGILYT
jgi:hypothetical protein